MVPENDQNAPANSAGQPEAESPMTILQRRLAEIEAGTPVTGQITEQPAQGSAPMADAAHPGASTAEASAASTEATMATEPASAEIEPSPAAAPAPGPAEAAVPESLPAPVSDPQRRALNHPGAQNDQALATEDEPEKPAPAAPAPQETAAAPVVAPAAAAPPVTVAAESLDAASPAPAAAPPAAQPAAQPLAAETAVSAPATDAVVPAAEAEASPEEEDFVPETPSVDFSTLALPEQTAHLRQLLARPDARQNRRQITDLQRQYDSAIAADRATAQESFVAGGGTAEDFAYSGPANHADLTRELQQYRESRSRDARAEDEQRAKNLAHKQYLLSQLRTLVESAETKDSSARIKALQNDWKATGAVPQKDAQELWNSYHGLLDIFYNNRGLFFEMKELDRRRNLEAKEGLLARAESLEQQPNINKALQELRQLHEEWKHIGPVPQEQRDAIWNRFLAASEKVHDRKKEFLSSRSVQENANLERKQALLDQMKPFAEFQTDRVNDWRSQTDTLQKLKEAWDAAGLVPRDKAEQMNKQFWGAYKGFFQRKNQFFKALDEEKNGNLKRKLQLIEEAEAALQNPDWEQGREVVIRLQKDWKTIGRVPEKQSDKVWNRFRTACDAFFERKHEESRQRDQRAQQLSQEQTARLEQVASTVDALTPDLPGTLDGFRAVVAEWTASSATAGRADSERLESRFTTLMGKYLDATPGLTYAERSDLLFQVQADRLKASGDTQQLYKKEQTLRREINELENDISTLKTNLEFFARSKNAGQLREEYQGRIDEAQQRIEGLKRQLKVIRS